MNHSKKLLLAACAVTAGGHLTADETSFPEILDAGIPGTPKLGQPILVTGSSKPILTEKHGLAAPALWDWNGDGKRDLLVGEFETKPDNDQPMGADGSTIRVYLNVGTDSDPKFTDEFEWARDTEGTIMEVPQWCCIGFTPQFYDLDDDGHVDMITGQYHPGEVTWFRGSDDGFLPGVKLPQEGDPASNGQSMFGNYDGEPGDIGTFHYWVYSSASFGDLDDDGDLDLVVGGMGGLRVSENIGSLRLPSFALRELLLDINDNPLRILDRGKEWEAAFPEGLLLPQDGDGKASPLIVDWDDDGVLDLLVTGSYRHPASHAVTFFRGVKTDAGHRFHPGVDLLPTDGGAKALPGSGQRVYVDDWNRDGVKDLIIGASIATVNGGEFSDELSWEWEDETKVESAGKDPGLYPPRERPTEESLDMGDYRAQIGEEEFKEMVRFNQEYWDDTVGKLYQEGKAYWLTMRHQGRIYVMLGERRDSPVTATQLVPTSETALGKVARPEEQEAVQPPVTLKVVAPEGLKAGDAADLTVNFTMRDGWYIYAPTGRNAPHGMIETSVEFEMPDAIRTVGSRELPLHHFKGLYDIYEGVDRQWKQPIEAVTAGRHEVLAKVTYQTCKDDLCLPPRTETLRTALTVADGGS